MKLKAAFFDVDGTLVHYNCSDYGSSWEAVHDAAGSLPEHTALLKKYIGRLDMYDRWVQESLLLLKGKDATMVRSKILPPPYNKNARKAVDEIKRDGLRCGILSSGLDVVCNYIKDDIGLDFCKCNEVHEENGIFTGTGNSIVKLWEKEKSFQHLCESMGIMQSEAVTIGDGENDIGTFEKSGLSIAYKPKTEKVASAADFVVHDFNEIPAIIRKF